MGTGRADARSVVAALAALAAVTLGPGGAAAAEAPVDLRTVERTGAWDDALACPPSVCRAAPDLPSPIVAVPADTLVERAVAALTREPRVELVAVDRELRQVVLVQRSAVLGFPDTIRVQAIETAGGNAEGFNTLSIASVPSSKLMTGASKRGICGSYTSTFGNSSLSVFTDITKATR